MNVKEKVRNLLKERGMSQRDLAAIIGVTEVGLSKSLAGIPSKQMVEKIANALHVDKEEIVKLQPILKAEFGSDKTPLILGNLELPCYVLENGMRVFSGRGIQNALGASNYTSGTWLSKTVNSKPICLGLSRKALDGFNNPIIFTMDGAENLKSNFYGYEATLLIDLCSAIIDANDSELFDVDQVLVKNANIIIRSVAKVGIIALVDEVTGYDKEKNRAKDELQQFLKKFISQEAARWVKTFDDSFFEMLYRLHNWNWTKTHRHPGIVGCWINDLVYERLGPMVLTELKKSKEEDGKSSKLHQYLTTDIGHPKLREHLASVQVLAKACDYKLDKFQQMIDLALPKKFQQMSLLFPDEYSDGK